MQRLVEATPRLNEKTVEKAYFKEYGQGLGDKNLPRDIAIVICNAFRHIRARAKNVKTGTRLSPVLWRILKGMADPPPNLVGLMHKAQTESDTNKGRSKEAMEHNEEKGQNTITEPTSPVQVCKAAKAHEDQSPGSVLAIYGVGREHVPKVQSRHLRKEISCVSLSSTEEHMAVASKSTSPYDENAPLAEQSSASSSQASIDFCIVELRF